MVSVVVENIAGKILMLLNNEKSCKQRPVGFYMMIAGTSTLALMDLWGRTLPPLT